MSEYSIGDLIGMFGKPKPEPVTSSADEWFSDFLGWLETDYDKMVHSDRKPGLHASSLGSVCGRRNILIDVFGVNKVPHTAGNYLTCDVGHALHYWWQERLLGPKQELLGDWMCVACVCDACEGTLIRKLDRPCTYCRGTGRKVTSGLMPMNCACGVPWQDAIRYLETSVVDSVLNYVGHCDGVLDHKPKKRLFEFKTISASEYEKLSKGPKDDHVVQAHAYMGPLGLEEAIILYENKASQCTWSVNMFGQFVAGVPKAIPFLVHYDEKLWAGIVERIHDHHKSVAILDDLKKADKQADRADVSKLPRVCSDKKCNMAQRCPVSRECFSLD